MSGAEQHAYQKGLTLIELLLYVSLSSIMLLSVSIFLFLLFQSRIRNQTITEVDGQGVRVMQFVTQAIRNAEVINAPSPGSSQNTISIGTYDKQKNPTTFDLSGGIIRIREGAGTNPFVSLTSARVIASGLTFVNVSAAGTPGSVQMEFALTHVNIEGRYEYAYAKTFYGSASVRQP